MPAVVVSAGGVAIASSTLAIGPWLVFAAWRRWVRSSSVEQAQRRLLAELPTYLDSLALRLAAGGSLAQALKETVPPPTLAVELEPLHRSLSFGRGLHRSVRALRSRLTDSDDGSPSLQLLVDTIEVLIARGGAALPSLERLNDTIRSAAWVDAEVRLQAGQATASAVVLAALPFLFAGGLAALDDRLAHLYLFEPIGAACLFLALGLSYSGWRWMARLARPRPVRRQPARAAIDRRRAMSPWLLRGLLVAAVLSLALLVSPTAGFGLLAAVAAALWLDRRRQAGAESDALAEALPEAIDRCTVVLGAGGTIRDCLVALAGAGPGRIRRSAADALDHTDRGHQLEEALRWFQLDLGPTFQPLTGALLLAHEQGGAIGELLARLSVEAGASRRRVGELRARQLPVALLIPLVVCSLPAVVIGAVVPLVVVAIDGVEL